MQEGSLAPRSAATHPDLAKLVSSVMTSSESCVSGRALRGGVGAPGDRVTSLSPVPHIRPSSHPGTCNWKEHDEREGFLPW